MDISNFHLNQGLDSQDNFEISTIFWMYFIIDNKGGRDEESLEVFNLLNHVNILFEIFCLTTACTLLNYLF